MKRMLYLVIAIVLLTAQMASAGLYYSALNRSEGGEGAAADWRVNAWVEGSNAKVEFVSSGNPILPAGSYLLTTDGGETVYMVNPKEGTYSLWDIDAMLQSASDMLGAAGDMMQISVENASVELLETKDGGELVGLDTTYYHYRTAYDLKMKIIGMKRNQSTVSNQQIWVADLKDHPALGVWLRKTPPSFGDSGLDELIKLEMGKIQGFPLKTVTESVVAGRKGRETTTRDVMEVTELEERNIPNDTFELDPDLVEAPMPAFGVPESGDEEKGGLRGLLKRRRGDG